MSGTVCDQLAELGTQTDFIVAGYTSKLQVLDVGINRPFKDNYEKLLNQYLQDGGEKPGRPLVATWTSLAWSAITVDTIVNTWRHIGIKAD